MRLFIRWKRLGLGWLLLPLGLDSCIVVRLPQVGSNPMIGVIQSAEASKH